MFSKKELEEMDNNSDPKWMFWLARMLGNKHTGVDGSVRITAYQWRGTWYFDKMERIT
jgi:hypothetical protein